MQRFAACRRLADLLFACGKRFLPRGKAALGILVGEALPFDCLFACGERLFALVLRARHALRAALKCLTLFAERLFACGKLLFAPVIFFCHLLGTGAHLFVEGGALFVEFLLIALFDLIEFIVVERGEIVDFLLSAFAARHTGSGVFEDAHIDERGSGVGEVKVLVRDETVDDGARIFPFRLILFGNGFSRFGQAEILSPAAADGAAPVGSDVAVLFKTLQCAVEGGLFQGILSVALAFDLGDDLIAVLVAVVEGAKDDGVDVTADEVGTDRLFAMVCLYSVVHILLLVFSLLYNIRQILSISKVLCQT